MPDPHVISALSDKAHELRSAIVSCEEHLERTRHELAVVSATLTIMQGDGGLVDDARPAHVPNLFKRGEALALCKATLADAPNGLSMRALGIACLKARGFDRDELGPDDAVGGLQAGRARAPWQRQRQVSEW